MYNIIDYIKWRGDIPFSQVGLNEVDNLIFSKLVYLDLSGIAEDAGNTIFDATRMYLLEQRDKEYIRNFKYFAKEEIELLKTAVRSERFRSVRVAHYKEFNDVENPTQFCACVFEITDDCIFVCFRGTDYTFNGWKEDLMMTTKDVIPSQSMALEFFNRVIRKYYPTQKIYLGGHSKGGNMAVFSAAKCEKNIQDRIVKVYSNDGPGFSEEFFEAEGFQAINSRVLKIIPQASFVGMLFDKEENYIVVKSKKKSFWQHDAFNWAVMGGKFETLDYDTKSIRFADKNMKEFLAGLTIEQKELIAEALYDVITSDGKITFGDVRRAGVMNIPSMIKAWDRIDDESKKTIAEGVKMMAYLSLKNGYEVNFPDKKKLYKHKDKA